MHELEKNLGGFVWKTSWGIQFLNNVFIHFWNEYKKSRNANDLEICNKTDKVFEEYIKRIWFHFIVPLRCYLLRRFLSLFWLMERLGIQCFPLLFGRCFCTYNGYFPLLSGDGVRKNWFGFLTFIYVLLFFPLFLFFCGAFNLAEIGKNFVLFKILIKKSNQDSKIKRTETQFGCLIQLPCREMWLRICSH